MLPSGLASSSTPVASGRRWNRIPVRWRLTGLYLLFLAVGLLVFGVVMYLGLRSLLYSALDEQVGEQTALVLLTIQEQGGNLILYPRDIGDLDSDEHFVRLFDANGRAVTDTSATFGGLPVDDALIEAAMSGDAQLTSVSADEETFRVMTVPVTTGEKVIGVLQVGMSREEFDEALQALVVVLLVSGPLALALAAAGGYLLAGRAMSPVSEITRMVASIDADDLDARLNLDLPDDELGQLAQTFDLMLARIEEAFDRQRRFTGDAAHELRTPLSLMRGRVDLALLGDQSRENYRETLVTLQEEIVRLTDIVSALLTLARADAGKLAVSYANVDLAEVIEVVAEQFAAQTDAAGIRLVQKTHACAVEGDEDLLLLLLVNLVANSLDATPAGGTVTLGCRGESSDMVLWVADTGSGIALEDQKRIFDRFYRTGQRVGGAGLGLNISQAIVAAHAGHISMASEPDQGTTVTVRLPVMRKEQAASNAR